MRQSNTNAALSAGIIVAVTLMPALAQGLTIHIAPGQPISTLEQARDAIRQQKGTAGTLAEPVRVVIADGRYTLTQPFVLTPADSGTADCPITYEAAPGASPIFSGGKRIGGFKQTEDGLWALHFSRSIGAAERAFLEHAGVEILGYLPVNGLLVRGEDPGRLVGSQGVHGYCSGH